MKTARLVFSILICFAATTVSADELIGADPGALQKHTGDVQEYYRLQKRLKKEAPPKEPPIEGAAPQAPTVSEVSGTRIAVKRIVTNKSDILSEEEIRGVTAGYEGKGSTIKELFEVVDKLNALYRQKGFITAKALLPPQKVEDGVVRIRLVEGRVGKVLVEGNEHTRESFILKRVSVEKGELVRVDALERDLVYFNAINDVRLRAALRAGELPGETDLVLKAEEPPNYEVAILADNAGTKTVGRERVGLRLVDYSLFGYRDILSATGYYSEGARTASAAYSMVLNAWGTRLSAGYDYNSIDVKTGPFADLGVGGDSYSYSVNLNHPLIFSPALSMNLFTGYQHKKSTTDFEGVTIARTKVSSFSLGFDVRKLDSHGLWYNRNTLTYGTEGLGGDESFVKYNMDLVRTLVHAGGLFTVFRTTAQLSSKHPLTSSEQYQLGGLSSVRGYPEGFLVGDEGYFVSAEVKFPLFRAAGDESSSSLRESVKGTLFVDHGAAFPYRGANGAASTHKDFITSVGFGFSFDFSQYLTGKFDVGFPLAKHGRDIRSHQFHFTLQSVVF